MVDKARSLQLTCNCIKLQDVRFFRYDYKTDDDAGLLHDFLALIENKLPTPHGGDVYTIVRNMSLKDDFAQAVNIGACALWYTTKSWPNVASLAHMQLSAAQLAGINPQDQTWDR
jgi:hypothetical protein